MEGNCAMGKNQHDICSKFFFEKHQGLGVAIALAISK